MIDVLKWDAAPHVLAYHYPNSELNYKSQLIVTESQEAVFVKEGQFFGPILPGRHALDTKNFPFLTKMISRLVTNGKSPYTADVWFVAKSVPLNLKWGTSDPILIEDPKYHVAFPVRAFGSYGLRIVDSCRFLARLMGRMPAFTEKCVSECFKGVIVARTKDIIATTMSANGCSLFDIGTKINDLSSLLERRLSEDLADYGVELRLFTINSISTDENDSSVAQVRKALAKKAEMEILGYSYTQERSFDALQAAAGNAGTAGAVMGAGIGLGMGAGVGIPMGQMMSEAAKAINPSGSRFCCNCGAPIPIGAKFCSGCGQKTE